RLKGAGGDPGPGLEALEAGDLLFELVDPFLELLDAVVLEADLILELPDAVLLEVDDLKQLLDQRRAVGFRDIGQRDWHGRIRPAISRPFCPGLLRGYTLSHCRLMRVSLCFRLRHRAGVLSKVSRIPVGNG